MFFLKFNYKSVIAITIGLMILCGCASTDKHIAVVNPQNNEFSGWPDQKLEKRFQEYWSNLFSGRVADAYQIETPYLREAIQFGKYNNYVKHIPNNKLVNVEIDKITKETGSLISISCVMRTQPVGGGKTVSTPIVDRWVFMGEVWYHVIKDPILLSF